MEKVLEVFVGIFRYVRVEALFHQPFDQFFQLLGQLMG